MNTWQVWGICAGVTLVCAIFCRVVKVRKWSQKALNGGKGAGRFLSVLLKRWLPPRAADKAEEDIIVTALELAGQFLIGIRKGMLEDNKKRVDKKNGK
jgi:hypothetical protein